MPTVPILIQSVQSTTDASSWTDLGGGTYQFQQSIVVPTPALGNTLVVEVDLSTLDPSFQSNFFGYTVVFSDGITYDDPSGGAGTFTSSGNVNSFWLLVAGWIDPSIAPPGNVTITFTMTAGVIPASPQLCAIVASEYQYLKDSYGQIGLMDIVSNAGTGSTITITDGYGGTQPGDNFYVAFGVAVEQTSDITASSPFVTQKSGTSLPNTSSSVYADYYSSSGESVTLNSTGSSPDYGLGGTIGAFDIVCACLLSASEYTFNLGDSITLSWTSNPYTLTASIDNGIGSVAVNGSTIVSPVATTTYNLSVTGPNGSTYISSVTLTLNPFPPPTCNLTIANIPVSGLPTWQANTFYQQASGSAYQSLIVDPNGNYQAILTGGDGMSGPSIPPVWGSTPGATTIDGGATWTCVVPLDFTLAALPYTLAIVKLGSTITLSWTSSNGVSATLSGGIGTVPLNGSGTYTPDVSLMGLTTINFGVPGTPPVAVLSLASPEYTLSVTNGGGTTTSTVYFMFYDPIDYVEIDCFAPVNVAEDSDYGGVAGGTTPVSLPIIAWVPNTQYNTGDQQLDSNGFAQVALAPGMSFSSAPVWASKGNVTTETTGLQWLNTGQIYPGYVTQRGFGPLWDGGQSTLGFGFEGMVIPSFITIPPAYTASTMYTAGQVVSILTDSAYFLSSGLQLLECIADGTTGPTDPSLIIALPYKTPGQIFSDNALNGGGTVVWKVLGSLSINLNWVGTQINAPDGYPAPGSPQGTGNLPLLFNGATQTYTLNTKALVEAFLTTPSSQDPTVYIFNTATIPATGLPVDCPTWLSSALGTGYINSSCSDGATINIGGTWAEFLYPVTPLAPPTGTITVVKSTVPSGSSQEFAFTPDWPGGTPFTLTDGQSSSSGPIPPGTYSVIETPVEGWVTLPSQDPTSIVLTAGQNIVITFTNTDIPPVPARVLPYLIIPNGQGQSIDELNGQSSISSLTIECIDPSNELKYLSTKTEVVGKNIYFKMGFEGMDLSDFVPLHVAQISDVGRTNDGKMRFVCRDNLAVLDRALWFCGGPQPVALPWLYGQRYEVGQYVQDSNGNIEQCVVAGTTSTTAPPIWPGTPAPPWEPNTSYTLGYWATDSYGNLEAVTTVPAGHTSTRPLNTGVSGNGFPNPPWGSALGDVTLDNSGGNPNGPISWTLIAINDLLGLTVTDGTVTWQIVAKPNKGAFGGSQAFYVYSLFGQNIQTPTPPLTYAWTSNQYPTLDSNPRYIQLNPIDALLVALQNELGVGQSPLLPPIVTTDPNNPSNALVFAPNPAWQQYNPGDDSTLINPNPFLDLTSILYIRDNQCSGQRFEWNVKRPVTAKQWIENEIMHPLGLYMFIGSDGRIGLHSMQPLPTPSITVMDSNTIVGTPDEVRLPVVNVVTVRCDVDDEGAYSAARVYDAEMTFAQQLSLSTYLQEFSHSVESNGLRLAYDSYGVAYLFSDRVFRRHGFGTPEYTIKSYLSAVRIELGDYILLSHPLMMDYKSSTGRLGLTNVLCQIMDKQPNYATGEITFKAWDLRFCNLSVPHDIAPISASVPNWTLATAAEKAKYMFVSYWPGWYSNGNDGLLIF